MNGPCITIKTDRPTVDTADTIRENLRILLFQIGVCIYDIVKDTVYE